MAETLSLTAGQLVQLNEQLANLASQAGLDVPAPLVDGASVVLVDREYDIAVVAG